MDKVFGPPSAKKALTATEFDDVASEVLKIPKIFSEMLHIRIEKVLKLPAGGKLTREHV
jgi:hypothetical protein